MTKKSNKKSNKNLTKKFVRLKAKTKKYLIDDNHEGQKPKASKKCVMKRKLKFENYKYWLEATQLENKLNYLERN